MKRLGLLAIVVASLFFASLSKSQSTGGVECARSDDYIYLYSSVTTLDVRRTPQCGEIVEITGTEKPKTPPVPSARTATGFTLAKDAPARVRLNKAISSATARAGDTVEFEVLEDVLVDGDVVIATGAKATGTVAQAEVKKHFGHDGKLAISVTSVQLSDNESAPRRCYYEAFGNSSSGAPVQLGSGKDATFAVGTDFKADRRRRPIELKREDFVSATDAGATLSADNPQSPQNPR